MMVLFQFSFCEQPVGVLAYALGQRVSRFVPVLGKRAAAEVSTGSTFQVARVLGDLRVGSEAADFKAQPLRFMKRLVVLACMAIADVVREAVAQLMDALMWSVVRHSGLPRALDRASHTSAHVSTRTATRWSSSITGMGTLPVRSISWMHWLFQRATLRVVKLSRPSTSRTKMICCSSSSMAWAHSGVGTMGVCLAVCAAAVSDAPEK